MRLVLLIFVISSFQNLPAQILNASFETWQKIQGPSTDYRNPDLWSSSNTFSQWNGLSSVQSTGDSYLGDTAVFIQTLPIGFGNTPYAGYIINGFPKFDTLNGEVFPITGGTPISFKPQRITGYYKFEKSEQLDSAKIFVYLKKWDSAAGKRDTVSKGKLVLGENSVYSLFQVPLTDLMPGTEPDSIVIAIYSSDPLSPDAGGKLWIDALSMDSLVSVHALYQEDKIELFPVPARTHLNVRCNSDDQVQLFIRNSEGRQMFFGEFRKSTSLETSEFPRGIYSLGLKKEGEKLIFRKIILGQ